MVAGPGQPSVAPPGDWQQITIFLSPMDVHINRVPVGGTRHARRPISRAGSCPPTDDGRPERAQRDLGRSPRGAPSCSARSSASWRAASSAASRRARRVERGERFGLMKFGSRMDVFLAARRELLVTAGRRRAGRRDHPRRVPAAAGRRVMLKARRFVPTARVDRPRAMRRGVYLLPSLFTVGNLFCGYACVIYAMRGDFDTAALFIGIAIVLDMLDGRIARMTGTVQRLRRPVRLARRRRVVRDGAGRPRVHLGPVPLDRLGWAAGFLFVTAAAMRLARFNIQTTSPGSDKRYFVGMPSPAAAGVPAATVFVTPEFLQDWPYDLLALPMVLVPAFLMVSTIRFRSFKAIDLGWRRSYRGLLLVALVIALDRHAPADRAGGGRLQLPGLGVHRLGVGPPGPPQPDAATADATVTPSPVAGPTPDTTPITLE